MGLAANTAKAADTAVLAGDIVGNVAGGGNAAAAGDLSSGATGSSSSVLVDFSTADGSGGSSANDGEAGPMEGGVDGRVTGVTVEGGTVEACVEAARASAATSCAVDGMTRAGVDEVCRDDADGCAVNLGVGAGGARGGAAGAAEEESVSARIDAIDVSVATCPAVAGINATGVDKVGEGEATKNPADGGVDGMEAPDGGGAGGGVTGALDVEGRGACAVGTGATAVDEGDAAVADEKSASWGASSAAAGSGVESGNDVSGADADEDAAALTPEDSRSAPGRVRGGVFSAVPARAGPTKPEATVDARRMACA